MMKMSSTFSAAGTEVAKELVLRACKADGLVLPQAHLIVAPNVGKHAEEILDYGYPRPAAEGQERTHGRIASSVRGSGRAQENSGGRDIGSCFDRLCPGGDAHFFDHDAGPVGTLGLAGRIRRDPCCYGGNGRVLETGVQPAG